MVRSFGDSAVVAAAAFLALTITVGSLAAEPIASSTFDTDNEGWRVISALGYDAPATYSADYGNPGGCIFSEVPDASLWGFSAPAGYLGNQLFAYHGEVRFDVGTDSPNVVGYVTLIGGGVELVCPFDAPATAWQWYSRSVSLSEMSGWFDPDPNTGYAPATQTDMLTVLSQLDSLYITGDFVDPAAPNSFGAVDNVALMPPEPFGGRPSFYGLGDLPGGTSYSRATGVSPDGLAVVGESDSGEPNYEGFLWWNGMMTGLGDLPGGAFTSRGTAVSSEGFVVVGSSESPNGVEAFVWQNGVMTALGDDPNGEFNSIATSISADGTKIVGYGTFGAHADKQAYVWENGVMSGLGDLPGAGFRSFGFDCSSDASVVVGWSESANGMEGFRWAGGVMTALGGLTTPITSIAMGVSGDGSVVVGYSYSDLGGQSFRWKDGVMSGLGDLPGGNFYGRAFAASGDGAIVVGMSTVGPGNEEQDQAAYVWDPYNGMRKLQDVLVNTYGLDLTGWILTRATDVSYDGSTIVGVGINPSGDMEGWIAQIGAVLTVRVSESQWFDYGDVALEPDYPVYPFGTPVTLTAQPQGNKQFKRWLLYDPNYPGDPIHAAKDANNPITLVMDRDHEVKAVFKCGASLGPMVVMMGVALLGLVVSRRRR